MQWLQKINLFHMHNCYIGKGHILEEPIQFALFDNLEQYNAYKKFNQPLFAWREKTAIEIGDKATPFVGYCPVCKKRVTFQISDMNRITVNGKTHTNLREAICCPECGLNMRLRGCMALIDRILCKQDYIYITEQTTSFYRVLCKRYSNVIGSEFISGNTEKGKIDANGIRNEDVTELTFRDNSMNAVLSFDVFEHVPNYKAGLKECYRVLQDGGHLIMTVPFCDVLPTKIRAILQDDGTIKHIMEPEYHGDPLSTQGCLCYYHFGWDILTELQNCGFKSARIASYWSINNGAFSIKDEKIIIAEK